MKLQQTGTPDPSSKPRHTVYAWGWPRPTRSATSMPPVAAPPPGSIWCLSAAAPSLQATAVTLLHARP